MASSACAEELTGPFGIEAFHNQLVVEGGAPAIQAGSHPYAMTTTIVLNNEESSAADKGSTILRVPNGDPKSVEVNLPVGLIVNPTATTERCSEAELETTGVCPAGSEVGETTLAFGILAAEPQKPIPVYNMETPPGEPAELGFKAVLAGITVHILGKVRTGGDYGLSANVPEIPQFAAFFGDSLTVWGRPPGSTQPFLTLPSSCGSPLKATMTADSWQEPGNVASASATSDDLEGYPVTVTGCEKLSLIPASQCSPQPTPPIPRLD